MEIKRSRSVTVGLETEFAVRRCSCSRVSVLLATEEGDTILVRSMLLELEGLTVGIVEAR